jgi:hypothetical protein
MKQRSGFTLFLLVLLLLFLLVIPASSNDTYGDILVKSDLSGALVSLDGFTNTFATPYQYYGVKTGRHSVKVTKPGYRMFTNNDVIVSPGMTTQVYATLLKDPDYGTIMVYTYPVGAEVTVDGIPRGKTPEYRPDVRPEEANLIIRGLQDGTHTVLIRLDGYADVTRTVTTGPAQTGAIHISENLVPTKPIQTQTPVSVQTTTAPVQTAQNPVTGGNINIESVPAGAQVMMNGTIRGITPLTLNTLPVGQYSLRLERAGYTPVFKSVEIKEGHTTDLSIDMLPVPTETPIQTEIPKPVQTPVPTPTQKSGTWFPVIGLFAGFIVLGMFSQKNR